MCQSVSVSTAFSFCAKSGKTGACERAAKTKPYNVKSLGSQGKVEYMICEEKKVVRNTRLHCKEIRAPSRINRETLRGTLDLKDKLGDLREKELSTSNHHK